MIGDDVTITVLGVKKNKVRDACAYARRRRRASKNHAQQTSDMPFASTGKFPQTDNFSLTASPRASTLTLMRQRDMQHHTYADYLTWSADSGNEVINGIAYIREPPSPSRLHQELVLELGHQLVTSLAGRPVRAYIAPLDVRLPKDGGADDQIDTVVQPDVFIVCDLQKLDERGMTGAPDWVAEILSPSTVRYDRTTKLRAYERAGVPEVWLIDPADRTLTIYRIEAGRYTQPGVLNLEGRTAIAAIPGVSIDWDRLLPHGDARVRRRPCHS